MGSRKKEHGSVLSWRPREENSLGRSEWIVQLNTIERSRKLEDREGTIGFGKMNIISNLQFQWPSGNRIQLEWIGERMAGERVEHRV